MANQEFKHPPSLWQAVKYWARLGCISFGGPAGQIAIMHRELVEEKGWISESRFLHALNYCMFLPGPEAQQLSIYIGWLMHRTLGGIIAGTLFVLPSFFILVTLSYIQMAFGHTLLVQGLFAGIKPAVVAILCFAIWRIGTKALKNTFMWALAFLSFFGIFILKLGFPIIVITAGFIGFIGGKLFPDLFSLKIASERIDSELFVREKHTYFSWFYLLKLVFIFFFLWSIALLLLPHDTLKDMGLFFTKAALITFGGAYAVLPYVYQGGVEIFHWLTGPQMIEGLALGETTPGPLIMVVSYVGFVGAWTKQILGPENLFLAGVLGATVATFFTFLPSFLFILAGAPLVESTHGNIKFTSPLTAITAAVVGVMVDLGLFFSWHVFFPKATPTSPFSGGFDWIDFLIAILAFVALKRFNISTVKVIFGSALLGLLRFNL